MDDITVKLVDGSPVFSLRFYLQRAIDALNHDGCLLLTAGPSSLAEIDRQLLPATAVLRLAGESSKFWRVDVEGGKSLEARGGDIIICGDSRTFEVISLGSFNESQATIRRVIKPPRTYFCPVEGCISSFNRKDNLRRHVRDQHKEFIVEQLDAPMQHNATSMAVERLSTAFPAVALVPEVRGFDEVAGLEDKLRMFSRAVASIMKREFPGFNLWAELRIGGTANDAAAAAAGGGGGGNAGGEGSEIS